MRVVLRSIAAVVLCLCAYSPICASAIVPGSKITVTFEGIVKRTKHASIPGGYDGLVFDGDFWAAGNAFYRQDPGFQAVIRGGVACVLPNGIGDSGSIRPDSQSLISIKSGHFAAFHVGGIVETFNAYRNGTLVGTMNVTLGITDTLVKFDKTFSNIDQFQIIGEVAFDNLVVKFGE
jgi:hypothetical protein